MMQANDRHSGLTAAILGFVADMNNNIKCSVTTLAILSVDGKL
jgi:hypothetical protein